MQRLQRSELRPIHSHAAVGLGDFPWCIGHVCFLFLVHASTWTVTTLWGNGPPLGLSMPPHPPVSGQPGLRGELPAIQWRWNQIIWFLDRNRDTVSPAKPAGMEPGREHLVPSTCPWMPLDAPGPRTRTPLAHSRTHTWLWIYERQC